MSEKGQVRRLRATSEVRKRQGAGHYPQRLQRLAIRAGARLEVVGQRQAHSRNRLLPGVAHWLPGCGSAACQAGGRHREEVGPGEAYIIRPGHDAWVVGEEPVASVDMSSVSVERYAKPE